jgi:hypothetical protein
MPDDARARVEAWMQDVCGVHGLTAKYRHECPDCLLTLAAAQREEEREAIRNFFTTALLESHTWTTREIGQYLDNRARREGPG